jgi:hypothetical protein
MDDDTNRLIIGAGNIAAQVFGGQLSDDQVYRLPQDGWPIFKVRGKLACRPVAMRAEIARREEEAINPQRRSRAV